MIKPGTPCILVPDGKFPPLHDEYVGVQCTFVSHDVPFVFADAFGVDTVVVIEGQPGRLCTRLTNLIPLGDDPDGETREEKRELTA